MKNNRAQHKNLVVSYELLQLLKWLVQAEPDTLREIIEEALENGLYDRLMESKGKTTPASEDLETDIANFFIFLETTLREQIIDDATNTESASERTNKELPANSEEFLANLSQSQPPQSEEMYKTFLKNWVPKKSCPLH